MTFQLPTDTKQITSSKELPPTYDGPLIPGAIALQGSTETYSVLVQEIANPLYKIRLYAFHFLKNLSLENLIETAGLHTHAALEGNTRHTFPGIGKMDVLEGRYAALYGNNIKGKTRFDANTDYRLFDISYSPDFVEAIADAYPHCAEAMSSKKVISLSKDPKLLDMDMLDCIQGILKSKFCDAGRAHYIDIKAKEYILYVLRNIYDVTEKNYRFSPSDREKIYEAKRLLLEDLSKPGYTITQLSLKVGLYESRLKTGFKYFFGRGILETLQFARMHTAKELLSASEISMKEIAGLVGYSKVTNFMTAFKEFFGFRAGPLQKN